MKKDHHLKKALIEAIRITYFRVYKETMLCITIQQLWMSTFDLLDETLLWLTVEINKIKS